VPANRNALPVLGLVVAGPMWVCPQMVQFARRGLLQVKGRRWWQSSQ